MDKDKSVVEKEYYGLNFIEGSFYKVTWLHSFWPNTPSFDEIMQCRFVNGEPRLFRKGNDSYSWRVDTWKSMYYSVVPSNREW